MMACCFLVSEALETPRSIVVASAGAPSCTAGNLTTSMTQAKESLAPCCCLYLRGCKVSSGDCNLQGQRVTL
jgi:hypothetical protein